MSSYGSHHELILGNRDLAELHFPQNNPSEKLIQCREEGINRDDEQKRLFK